MNEEQFKKLLRDELNGFATKADLSQFATKDDIHEVRQDLRQFKAAVAGDFETVNEKLDELKASADSHDRLLEQYPVERIERLEKHAKLPTFKFSAEPV